MRHPIFPLFLGLSTVVACSGGDDEEDAVSHCDEPGVICNYSGIPEIASLGGEDMPATESGMYLPLDLTFHEDGTAYVIDWNNHRIRHIDHDGVIQTVSGTGFLGDGPEGDALTAAYNHPTNLAFNPVNPDQMAIAAWHNSRLEIFDVAAGTITFIAGTGTRDYNGSSQPARETFLDLPSGVTWDAEGENLYFMDQANQLIRVLTPSGQINDIAGHQRDPGYDGDGGPARDAVLHASTGQAADPSNRLQMFEGRLYMVDSQNNAVRMIDEEGFIFTIGGNGNPEPAYSGDGGPATDAEFAVPRDLAIDADGNIFVADTDNSCVRMIDTDGIVNTYAGTCGVAGFGGDNGQALDSLLNKPFGIAVDADGNVYVADTYNQVIRKITR